jgi:hypothetical protein
MYSLAAHPALQLVLKLQARGWLRRMRRSFSTPRRIVLSLFAVMLAMLWLGNIALSVLFREAYDGDALRSWSTWGFLVYGGWHFLKAAWQRPTEGIVWSAAEQELCEGGPFARRELVQYRMLVLCSSAVFKAAVATVLLLPDLRYPALGLLGMCLSLTLLEFLRFAVDTVVAGLTRREYWVYRGVLIGGLAIVVVNALITVITGWTAPAESLVPVPLLFARECLAGLRGWANGPVAAVFMEPARQLVELFTVERLDLVYAVRLAGVASALWMLVESSQWLDRLMQRRRLLAERARLPFADRSESIEVQANHSESAIAGQRGRLPIVWLGPVAWRQLLGARQHFGAVLLALVAPAMLSLLPFLMLEQPSEPAFANLVASLAFYTLLLLPAALKYDFRRDYDRLLTLKMLPLSSWQVACGQILAPVLIATTFQWAMILAAYITRPVPAAQVLAALLIFVPANLAIFSLDNLLFLLFPHRIQQEGIDVFLRTTLTFTAKGIVFAVLLAGVLVWSIGAKSLSEVLPADWGAWREPLPIFGVGLFVLTTATAASLLGLTSRAFRRYDPSQGAVA